MSAHVDIPPALPLHQTESPSSTQLQLPYDPKASGKAHLGATISPAVFLVVQVFLVVVFVSLVGFQSVVLQAGGGGGAAIGELSAWLSQLEEMHEAVCSAQRSLGEELHVLSRGVSRRRHSAGALVTLHQSLTELDVRLANRIGDLKKQLHADVIEKTRDEISRAPAIRVPAGMQFHHGMGDAGARAPDAPNFDNEYPSEPVSEIPGPAYAPPPDELAALSPDARNSRRRSAVVDAFKHSWEGYVKHSWRFDELQPRSKTGKNWNELGRKEQGMGLTILDAMTTMHLMGLTSELDVALRFIREDLSVAVDVDASVFESTIRILGSLLSIYELTGERHKYVLDKAVEVADRLLWAFNTSSGLPHQTVNLATKRHSNAQWSGGGAVLSEFGTIQLEFRTLSYHTGNPVYDMRATHIMSIVAARAPRDGLCPVYMSIANHRWMTDHVSLGAMGDSYYEYLLKQYLLTNKTEPLYKDMFIAAANGIADKLLFYSVPSKWAYVAEFKRRDFYPKMDHLACFVAGTLALGAQELNAETDALDKQRMMKVAAELTETCVRMYTRQQSGVSPEYVEFPGRADFINGPGYYILRPETFESLFYMWRFTKEEKWRDMGWRLFRAIDRWCRVPTGGFAGLREVNVKDPIKDNLQQSFWLAETLKYAYLLFADDSAADLKQWVFNTEAHPLRIRTRDPMDVWRAYEQRHGEVPWQPPVLEGVQRAETAAMRARRLATGSRYAQKKDQLGEYDAFDGPADDDGMPFDPSMMEGIPRPGVPTAPRRGLAKPMASQATERRPKTRAPAAMRHPSEPDIADDDGGAHEEQLPKAHAPVSPEERRAALERQKRLREAEKERAARDAP